jgi:micrococcal nuclease
VTVWTVPATVVSVYDADTLWADLDLGWRITYRTKIRLAGVNAPELDTPAGVVAREWVINQIRPIPGIMPTPVTVVSHSLDKYGRVLADVYWWEGPGSTPPLAGQHHLNADLLASGNAVVMKG